MFRVFRHLIVLSVLLFFKQLQAQTSVGKELEQIIQNRSIDPNSYLKQLERFQNYENELTIEEQFILLNQFTNVYARELDDFNKAIFKIDRYETRPNSTKYKPKIASFCSYQRAFVYSLAPKQFSKSIGQLERILKPNIESQIKLEQTDLDATLLYTDVLSKSKSYYKSLKFQQRILNEILIPENLEKAKLYLGMALNFSSLGKMDSCRSYLYLSFNCASQEKNDANIARSAIELGQFLKYGETKKEALNFFLKAYNRINYLDNHETKLRLCKYIGELYKSDENTENALKFKEIELKYADSVKADEKVKLDAIHTYELNKNRKGQLAYQNAFHLESSRVKWLAFAGALVITLSLFLYFRRNRKKQDNSASQLGFDEIVEQLKKPENELPQEKERMLQNLISDLQSTVSAENWEDFERSFNKNYPNFQDNLSSSHPKLSTNERKLCICLSQNLSSKEISPLTGQNAHAINIARGRLRKKLGIDHQEIQLPEYLSRFL